MNRIDRLNAILIHLQSKKIVKAQEIADRFNISLRTVYRDIRSLEQGGVPIGAEAGIGYFINSEYHLPPIMFKQDEASAFLLAEKLISKFSDAKVSDAFKSALFKVKSVLKSSEKDHLENLENKISILSREPSESKNQNLYLMDIQTALANKKQLRVVYTAIYNGKSTQRDIEPVSLCNYDMNWHLIAYCLLRQDYRDFRLDRFSEVSVLDGEIKQPNLFNLNDYFKKITRDIALHTIVLKVEESIFPQLKSSKYWFGLLEEQKEENYYQMTFANSNLHTFAKWVLSMEDKVEIISPDELKQYVKDYVEDLAKHYLNILSKKVK